MTDTVPFNVKWNKDSFQLDFVIAEGVKGLKTQLEEKTGVPAERMKIMPKSKGVCVCCRMDSALYVGDCGAYHISCRVRSLERSAER